MNDVHHEPVLQGDMFICPPAPKPVCPLDAVLAVGFGMVRVRRNGRTVWSGDDERVKLRRFDRRAAKERGHGRGRWSVEFYGPLSGSTFTRNRVGDWVLTDRNEGFA